jgi:hypothetical protein
LKHSFYHLHICFDIFLLIQRLSSSKTRSFFKVKVHFLLTDTVKDKNQLALEKTFLLLRFPILLSNSCCPFSIKATI